MTQVQLLVYSLKEYDHMLASIRDTPGWISAEIEDFDEDPWEIGKPRARMTIYFKTEQDAIWFKLKI